MQQQAEAAEKRQKSMLVEFGIKSMAELEKMKETQQRETALKPNEKDLEVIELD